MIEYKHNPSLENDFEDKKIGKGVWSPSALPDTHKSIEELKEKFIEAFDKGEFEWNHHEGDIGGKPISPMRIWNTFIEPTLHSYAQQQVQEAVGEIEKIIPKEKPMNVFPFVLKGEELEMYMMYKGFNQCRGEILDTLQSKSLDTPPPQETLEDKTENV